MKLKVDEVKQLINEKAGGNYNKFARMIEVDPAHLYRAINYGKSGGAKIIGAIIKFCEEEHLDFSTYIFLT